jgi:thiamine biosynthesis protein ThiI
VRRPDLALVRFGEIGIKRGNRHRYIQALCRNIQVTAAASNAITRIRDTHNRVLVDLNPDAPPTAQRRLFARLADTPGVHSFSPAFLTGTQLGELEHAVVELADAALAQPLPPRTFRVRCARSDKQYPMTSEEIERHLGARVLEAHPTLQVRLKEPELVLGVEVQRRDKGYVYRERISGPGGVPVGTAGGVIHLLSGGFDSPVAGALLQARGIQLTPVYFHSFPLVGDAAKHNVLELAGLLGRRQERMRVAVVPFAHVQTTLRDACSGDMLVVLYRRMMFRVADRLAAELRIDALSTGDSVSQVASQTLPNLRTVQAVTQRPVLRPLCGFHKEEIIARARAFGTYDISARPADDCCSLFVPRRPRTRTFSRDAQREEASVDVDALVTACLEGVQWMELRCGRPVGEAAT